jgi:hypothetical protein
MHCDSLLERVATGRNFEDEMKMEREGRNVTHAGIRWYM